MSGLRILVALGYAVFQRTRGEFFQPALTLPSWSCDLLGVEPESRAEFDLGQRFPFLEDFFLDAQPIWNRQADGVIRSGVWQATLADDVPINLDAAAMSIDGSSYLVLQNLDLADWNPQALLQSGRDGQLRHHREILDHKRLEGELAKAKEAAEELSRAKGEFLANMSHEVRTPLAGILGITSLLMDTEISAEQQGYLESLSESARSLLRIVNDVLDFSKIEAGKLDFEVVPFRTVDLIDDLRHRFEQDAAQKGLAFDTRVLPGTAVQFNGDKLRLRQVLDNLVQNGLKFTSTGEVTVTVEPATDRSGGEAVQFSVADTGIGIPQDKQHTIFASFTQADSSIERKFGGTGLGLAIVSKLVRMMGGELTLTSTAGRGSTFSFVIPTRLTGRPALASAAEPGHAGLSDVRPRQPVAITTIHADDVASTGEIDQIHVLLAEDHEINRMLVTRMLTKLGFQVTAVSNGQEAVSMATSRSFDVILMDCQMPEMSGFEATAAIREHEQTTGERPIPIVAITAHAMAGFRDRCLRAGMDDYICKPFQPAELANTVRQAMSRQVNPPAPDGADRT